MKTKTMCLIFLLAALLTSCAAYHPVIDTASVRDKQLYEKDLFECRQLALQNAEPGTSTTEGAVIGGGIGAAFGALVAAIFDGNVGRGAALGALVGGTQGALHGAAADQHKYEQIYGNCMRGRGYEVLY